MNLKKFFATGLGIAVGVFGGAMLILTAGQLFGQDWLVNFATWLPVWGGTEEAATTAIIG